MIYELHLTVKPDTDIPAWTTFCADLGVKPLRIQLVGGNPRNPVQVMTAGVFEDDDHFGAVDYANAQAKAVEDAGFEIERFKLEIPLDKAGAYDGRAAYHECHIKCLVDRYQRDRNNEAARSAGWIASFNQLKLEDDGFGKWYYTKRLPGDYNYRDAGSYFAAEFANLPLIGAVRLEKETVIFDSHPALDAGWAT